ncbi:MAG TPA: DUF4400 domain-containing protein [Rhodocyclaceae bacterium]|uniref:DUF4400 domain-containing protein n=1 Tax=Dechloromonas agitata TaxID=73030 RepID=A0A930BSK2_9RHOO|nr:DUF4400 domain-containing protein [Accumulibacter sp.]MBF1164859.1 DUF4400 domain-containing protein [Dechloromonas agitata]HMW53724.1 DUF4400 domain-containing protein [Rhodocyclaceae bacterium]HNA45576.1 DUF4400 domain-containing protein [Nitrospira sp.]HMZ76213.1 DUF4400 domain-containing protein [Rhodocyclaceae bacterium]HNG14512.1 DUF4400 domain-containing protein [Accumulibacter sp.]
MPRQEHQRKGEWTAFFATLLAVGIVALWALIPTQVLEATWQAEQQQMSSWAGESADRWIKAQAVEAVSAAAREAERTAAGLGDSAIERWLTDRIYASLLWANLALYRAHALLMWSLLGIPLILAASVDGFYVREIRKTAFISQSPIRHKIGVHFFRLVSLAVVAWLCLPLPMPIVVAPLVVSFMALSMWLWVGHLQKRL